MAAVSYPQKNLVHQSRWVVLLAVAVFALYLCWLMLQPFIEVLLWAVVLVIVFYPVHRRIEAKTGRPGWSALASCLLVILVILAPLTLLTFAVVREITSLAQGMQGNLASLLDPNSPTAGPLLRWVGQYVDLDLIGSQQFLAERLKGISTTIANRTLGFVGGALGLIIQIFFVIFTMFYLFRDGDLLLDAFRDVMPLEEDKSVQIFKRTREVIGASVYGVLVIAAIQGAIGGLAFWVLGLPSPLLWGVVMILLSMIPLAGAFIVWVPAAIILAVSGEWGKALILALVGAFVIGTIDNLLRPKLVGEKTKLHELLIFFSVLGGLQVFGILGLVLGPVIVAITIALLDILRHASDRSSGEGTGESLFETTAPLHDVGGQN